MTKTQSDVWASRTEPWSADNEPPRRALRVLIVDDHGEWRRGFRSWLNDHPDIVVVGEARTGDEAVELTPLLRPAIVLMDVRLPGMSGVEATRRIRLLAPAPLIIGLSVHGTPQMEQQMREAGAAAYLDKEEIVDRLYEIMCSLTESRESSRTSQNL